MARYKRKVKSLDGIPEPIAALYAETDDGYELQYEFEDPKVSEFRDTNVKLKADLEKIQEQLKGFDGVDRAKYDEGLKALTRVQELEQQLQGKSIDEILTTRTKALREEHDKLLKTEREQRAALEAERDAYLSQLGVRTLQTTFSEIANKVGQVREGAMEDIINLAVRDWKPQPVRNGNDVRINIVPAREDLAAPGEDIDPEKWMKSIFEKKPYLFETGQGGGARGGAGTPPPTGQVWVQDDPLAKGRNLEAIASGKAVIRK